jgi:Thioredoxin like C-terminal domain
LTSVMPGEEAGNITQSRMSSPGMQAAKTTPGRQRHVAVHVLSWSAQSVSRGPARIAWKTVIVTRSGRHRRSRRRALARACARLRGGHASTKPELKAVLAPGANGPIPFRVLLDGETPGPPHGVDVDEDGNGLLREGRLYQLVRERETVRGRTLEITFLKPGAQAYAFTFG